MKKKKLGLRKHWRRDTNKWRNLNRRIISYDQKRSSGLKRSRRSSRIAIRRRMM